MTSVVTYKTILWSKLLVRCPFLSLWAVSYTHLDVYKRQDDNLVYLIDKKNKVIISTDDLGINIIKDGYSKDRITLVTVSYTHLKNNANRRN